MSRKLEEVVQFTPMTFYPAQLSSSPVGDGEVPPDDFVVSRHADGRVASTYGELVWDRTPYDSKGASSKLNFKFWKGGGAGNRNQKALVDEVHWVTYLLGWRRPGPTYANETLDGYVDSLRALARHCEATGVGLKSVLTTADALLEALYSLKGVHARRLSGILSVLAELGSGSVGYSVVGDHAKKRVADLAREYADSLRQFAPLPTRIYSHVISTLAGELADFEQVADKYFELAERCSGNPLLGRTKSVQIEKAKRIGIVQSASESELSELLEEYGLAEYFKAKSLATSVKGISAGLYRIQMACRLTIHVFSGMRDEEVGQVPYSCLDVTTHNRNTHYVIFGFTTKLNNGKPKPARWVTSRDGARAIALAQRI